MAELAIPEQPEVVIIPFHGESVYAVDAQGKPHIILKPAVEALGLDYWAQVRKLRSRSWACTASRAVQLPGDTQRREVITCDIRTFLMLLATVDENRVAAEVKPKLVTYQAEIADAVEAYWTTGKAINPRIPRQPSKAEVALAMAQAVYDHEQRLDRIDDEVAVLGARVDGIEQRTGWFVALAYAKIHHLPSDTLSLQRLGKEAARIARRDGIDPGKVPNERYGYVNSYPEDIWQEAAQIFQKAAQ